MQEGTRSILALDLGTSSIGWALFGSRDGKEPAELIDLGVRQFDEVVEPDSKELKNLKRRTARGTRKNLRRRRQRRDAVLAALRAIGLVGDATDPFAESGADPTAPYRLRAEALERQLTPDEFGRALFHLGRRRGFKSNRRAKMASIEKDPDVAQLLAQQRTDLEDASDPDEGEVLQAIESLRHELQGRTLGQYLWDQLQAGQKVRKLRTDRGMYVDEFEAIWRCQAAFDPARLTPEARSRVFEAIFFQRPLKTQKFLKGPCSLEPRRVRAERAQLVSQRFRYWQDLSLLELTHRETGERRLLTLEERHRLAEQLEQHSEISWSSIRKTLALDKGCLFNLERAKAKGLKGNSTAARVQKVVPELWHNLDEAGRERLVEVLLTMEDRGKLYQSLRRLYALDVETAYRLAVLELEPGTASLSSRAMRRILPHLQAGLSRTQAQVAAGYEPWNEEIMPLARLESAPSRQEISNPRVRKALGQVRRVVNAILRTYGRPTVIRIEMARELSLTAKEKKGLEEANNKKRKENDRARAWYASQKVANPDRAALIWYRLAEQCNWECPYTGAKIPQELSSLSRFEIEHIVPYTRCLDDSFNNLTLCEAHANAQKGNRTPFEAFGHTREWEAMKAHVAQWKGPGANHKRKRFLNETPPDTDKMVERQLNETKFICRAAAAYLRPVADEIETTKGAATAMLREHWGLMTTLYDSPTKQRDDLRHHAVDAVAIAFTTRSIFQAITKERKRATQGGEVDLKVTPLSDQTVPPAPAWLLPKVRERLATVVISREPTRSIQDAFHEETALGLRNPAEGKYHTRKPLVAMTERDVNSIVDPELRRKALDKFHAHGRDAKKAFADGLEIGTTRSGKVLLAVKARIEKIIPKAEMLRVPSEAPTKFFVLGNNHHVEIFEHEGTGKRAMRTVSTLEAAKRARIDKRAIVDTQPDQLGWRFVMWLALGDVVRVEDLGDRLYRLESIMSTNNQLRFRALEASSTDDNSQRLLKSPSALNAIKVNVDPLGRIREVPEGVV